MSTSGMDLGLPGEDDERRQAVRRWLAEHPQPTPRQLAEAGYVTPHWPRPWGLDADPVHQLIIDEELQRASVRRPQNQIAMGWAGPTIIHAGTDEQKQRYLMPLLAGEEIWCQLFSEPGAGSDLASLSTRATREGDGWIVNGQKVWTSGAQFSRYGILLARTDPDAPKHRGISYFICPMDAPGVTVRPLREMTGAALFNEVFLDDVYLGPEALVGEEGDGWKLAKVTLGNERVSLSSGGALWGAGPTAYDLLELVQQRGGTSDPGLRDRLVQLYVQAEALRLMRLRMLAATLSGQQPGPEASVRKLLADEHGQDIMNLARDLAGPAGLLEGAGPLGEQSAEWHRGWLFAPALTIGGGTSQVQKNILAERVLGLPRDADPDAGRPWNSGRVRA